MNERLLYHYQRELQYVRDMGLAFSLEYPKIAGRLGMQAADCKDPYVERLLEGFAFLTARVQLELEAKQPLFSQYLLEMLYPHFLAPTPSMAVVRFFPDVQQTIPPSGVHIPAQSALLSNIKIDQRTTCEFRTAHSVQLLPVSLDIAEYIPSHAALLAIDHVCHPKAVSALRLRFSVMHGFSVDMLDFDSLPVFLTGGDGISALVYEMLLAQVLEIHVRSVDQNSYSRMVRIPGSSIEAMGFSEAEALLPISDRAFSGYRMLQEYFACPERFLFVAFSQLHAFFSQAQGHAFEIIIQSAGKYDALVSVLDHTNFLLFCTPASNLFPRRGDRIHIDHGLTEFHILADRTRPLDFEVFSVGKVEGYGDLAQPAQEFSAFYSCNFANWHQPTSAFYTIRREPRRVSSQNQRRGVRSSYLGHELFLSLVDGQQAPYGHNLRQLGVSLLCTNRDLPLHIPIGTLDTDFILESGGPVASIRAVVGPTRPRETVGSGHMRWKLLSHLQLNYLSLLNRGEDGASALREILTLYHDPEDQVATKQISGVSKIWSKAITRRLPVAGPPVFARGLEISLALDESAYVGLGAYLFACVLRQFLLRHASVNTFVEIVLCSLQREEVARWPAIIGNRPVL